MDTLIIGGGPAGLVAGIYLARYRRKILLLDDGTSRARYIPVSHNAPGFPDGISGANLLSRLRSQARHAGVTISREHVRAVRKLPGGFEVVSDQHTRAARTVLLATGSSDHARLPGLTPRMTLQGSVRWCPICDGYESLDRRIVLLGEARHGPGHALFLRTYSRALTLVIAPGRSRLSKRTRAELGRAGIELVEAAATGVRVRKGQGRLATDGGQTLPFEVLYIMSGGHCRSALVAGLGARHDRDDRLRVNSQQQTSVPGLYAAGDVVSSLKQISVAVAEGAIAATAIHHCLPKNYR